MGLIEDTLSSYNQEIFPLLIIKNAWEEVLKTNIKQLASCEKRLNEELEEICKHKISLCEEVNEFDEKYGILSAWWNAEMLTLEDPFLGRNAKERELQKDLNDKVVLEIQQIKCDIDEIERTISNHRKKLIEDEEILLQLRSQIEELKTQPFGPQFLSLKAALQESKENCEKMGSRIKLKLELHQTSLPSNMPHAFLAVPLTESRNHTQKDNTRDLQNITPQTTYNGLSERLTSSIAGPAEEPKDCRVLKMLEKTTIVFKRQASKSDMNYEHGPKMLRFNTRITNSSENFENGVRQPWVDLEDDNITHF